MMGPFKSPSTLREGLAVAKELFLNYRFERRSPMAPLPSRLLHVIASHEVVLPPPKLLSGEGSLTVEGLCFLAGAVRALRATQAFEIGTLRGVTAWTLARNMDQGIVYTLDIPSGTDASLPLEESDEHIRTLDAQHVYGALPVSADIVQLWGDSASFDFSRWHGRCDLVFIDGAHSEPYVESDSRNAFEIVSDRGMIVWDDYWRLVHGVPTVLHRLMQHHRLYRVPSTRLCVYLTPTAEDGLSRHQVSSA